MLYLTHLFIFILFRLIHVLIATVVFLASSHERMDSSTQYWSDEDDDDATQIETSIHLGVPDGPVESASDLNDAAVSRIGGLPALLSHDAPFDSSRCRNCQNAMELLVQLWAPFEDSPYDRAAYVWGCARSGCQRKSGRYVPLYGIYLR